MPSTRSSSSSPSPSPSPSPSLNTSSLLSNIETLKKTMHEVVQLSQQIATMQSFDVKDKSGFGIVQTIPINESATELVPNVYQEFIPRTQWFEIKSDGMYHRMDDWDGNAFEQKYGHLYQLYHTLKGNDGQDNQLAYTLSTHGMIYAIWVRRKTMEKQLEEIKGEKKHLHTADFLRLQNTILTELLKLYAKQLG